MAKVEYEPLVLPGGPVLATRPVVSTEEEEQESKPTRKNSRRLVRLRRAE